MKTKWLFNVRAGDCFTTETFESSETEHISIMSLFNMKKNISFLIKREAENRSFGSVLFLKTDGI